MMKTYKYRIYPNNKQKELFEKTFGCVRFYWNKALEIKLNVFKENAKKPKEERRPIPRVLPSVLKRNYPFLKEVDSIALNNAQLNLERAFQMFFSKKLRIPKFKKKKAKQSYTTNNINNNIKVNFENQKIKLPKIGWIKIKLHRKFEGKIKCVTVSKTTTCKYFVSIFVENETQESLPPTDNICAIDVGLQHFIVMVDNKGRIQKISHPKWISKMEKKIKRQQKALSRKQKGSKNWEKQRAKLAKLHERKNNQKEDFLHKLSTTIIRENQAVVVEKLNIRGLLSKSYLAKYISDSSWGQFLRYLNYKADLYGRQIIEADMFYPSSKLCNSCGYKRIDLKLSEREWQCPLCKTKHDRDVNAAKNLLTYGFIHLKDGRVGSTRTEACGETH